MTGHIGRTGAVRGKPTIELAVKSTRHGPVLYEDANRHRAFALKWVGSEPGGAGYIADELQPQPTMKVHSPQEAPCNDR
jgi:hypothetical protein